MATDKVTDTLIEALKQALSEPGEQRLYRSGKLAGLFPGRTGANAEAAARALHEGLLEVLRTETKGKTTTEWVRPTPRGVDFLHDHESPVQALKELRGFLQVCQEGVPPGLAKMQQDIHALADRLAEDGRRILHQLDSLSRRVEESLRRADVANPSLPEGTTATVPWALDALAYLDRRQAGGAAGNCPLPELFAALRAQHTDLSVADFHNGLRRLNDRRALQLLPFSEPPSQLPEPEYALLEGTTVMYYVTR